MPYPTRTHRLRHVLTRPAFTAIGIFTSNGRTVTQTQTFTESFVITEIEKGTFVYLPDRGERYLLDATAGCLRRLGPTTGRIQRDTLRSVLGEIHVERAEDETEIEGFLCQQFTFRSENARIYLEGETFATRVPGIEKTALPLEREYDSLIQPFSLPLDPDHLVVSSTLRSAAGEFDQVQSYRLVTIRAGIHDIGRYDELTSMRVTEFPSA